MTDELEKRARLTNHAIYLRGLFIQRYAGIEFSLTHLLVVASLHPTYQHLGELPFRTTSKLGRLEEVLDTNGPLQLCAAELRKEVDYLNSIELYRNILAHGIMVVQIVDGKPLCRFRLYQHKDGDAYQAAWDLTMPQLEALAEDVQPHSTAFTKLVAEITKKQLLPHLVEP